MFNHEPLFLLTGKATSVGMVDKQIRDKHIPPAPTCGPHAPIAFFTIAAIKGHIVQWADDVPTSLAYGHAKTHTGMYSTPFANHRRQTSKGVVQFFRRGAFRDGVILPFQRIAEVNCTVAEWGDAGDVRILCEGCRKPFQPAFRHNHIRIEKHKTGRTHMTDGNVDGLHKAEIRLVAQE